MKYIVTHGRRAHRDDFLAVALALAIYGARPVFRRDPTEEELEDKDVLVLDVGGRHEPEIMNFDHHQRGRDEEPECALSLFMRHEGYEGAFKLRPWWDFTVVKDAGGPRSAAKMLGMDTLPIAMDSPVENTLLSMFASTGELSETDTQMLMAFGDHMLKYTVAYAADYARVKEIVDIQEVGGVPAFVVDTEVGPTLNGILGRYRDLERPDVAISVSPSPDAEASWVLYRYDDDPRVDFTTLRGLPEVKFSHASGFLAVLKSGVSLKKAIKLASRAVNK
jgi:hypothetical protein